MIVTIKSKTGATHILPTGRGLTATVAGTEHDLSDEDLSAIDREGRCEILPSAEAELAELKPGKPGKPGKATKAEDPPPPKE